jgi:hypothetical protein
LSGARIDPGSRASLDERFAIASVASASERENRPRHLVLLAAVVFAASLVYLSVQASERSTAKRQLKGRIAEVDRVEGMATEIKRLDEQIAANAAGSGVGVPMPDVLSRLEGFATEAGLKDPLSHRRGPGRNEGGATLYTYPYEVRDPSLESVMTWLQKSVEGIPGLEVQSVRIRPEPTAWSVQVTLSRWERSQ